jgi:hypothetical protein
MSELSSYAEAAQALLSHTFVWYNYHMTGKSTFEWDDAKDHLNQEKHGVTFAAAQLAFLDPLRRHR